MSTGHQVDGPWGTVAPMNQLSVRTPLKNILLVLLVNSTTASVLERRRCYLVPNFIHCTWKVAIGLLDFQQEVNGPDHKLLFVLRQLLKVAWY